GFLYVGILAGHSNVSEPVASDLYGATMVCGPDLKCCASTSRRSLGVPNTSDCNRAAANAFIVRSFRPPRKHPVARATPSSVITSIFCPLWDTTCGTRTSSEGVRNTTNG